MDLSPLIQYAKTEHLRCLIEVYKDGLTILYCDKHRKREFLRQIRINKIRKRIKIVTYGYDIKFEEDPKLTELDYIRGKVIKYFRKDRTIREICPMYFDKKLIILDLPIEIELDFECPLFRFDTIDQLKKIIEPHFNATINRDKDTFIIYYEGGS